MHLHRLKEAVANLVAQSLGLLLLDRLIDLKLCSHKHKYGTNQQRPNQTLHWVNQD
jgi:hypothetical protein